MQLKSLQSRVDSNEVASSTVSLCKQNPKQSKFSIKQFNQMIIDHQKDERLAIQEIINDYPETKRIVNLENTMD